MTAPELEALANEIVVAAIGIVRQYQDTFAVATQELKHVALAALERVQREAQQDMRERAEQTARTFPYEESLYHDLCDDIADTIRNLPLPGESK
jgi:hypothetical protein